MQSTTLTVISEDSGLIAMCREALRDLSSEGSWELVVAKECPDPVAGVCLWDYSPGEAITVSPGAKHLFVVSPRDLTEFREAVPMADGSILIKPLTRAVLHAFLGSMATANASPSLAAERDELLGCLLEANLKLQEYDRRRTNFLARAVHEFRVPLTALSGYCGLLAAGELGELNPNQLDALRRMRHSVTRMVRMTTAMFELSIAGQSEQQPQLQEGGIAECIKRAMEAVHPLAEEKDLRLETGGLAPAEKTLLLESEQIEQVLVNLLDNACKASPRRSAIEIRGYPYFWERRFLTGNPNPDDRRQQTTSVPNSYRIDVVDQGPGVRPEHLESVFEEYTSYFGSHDRSGGGLGLAICRLIVQRHNGRIWASSGPAGAMFSFVLPYAEAKRAQKAAASSQRSKTA